MAWFYLILAGLLEVVWALMLKQSEGFSRPIPTLIFVISLVASMFLLSQSVKSLPIGTAYAVWTGIGAAGTAIFGMVWLGEPRDLLKTTSLILLLAGIAGMKLSLGE